MATPYDEPDVGAPLAGNRSAYDDDIPPNFEPRDNEMGQAIEMGAVGVAQMGGKIANAYDEDTAQQKDEHQAPPPPSYIVNLCNWFPLRLFSFIAGCGLIAAAILDFIFNDDAFIQFILRIYLLFFGIVIMSIESPVWTCTRWIQTKVFFWFRILARMWGRAWFYLFVTILCFGEFDQENVGEWVCFMHAMFYIQMLCYIIIYRHFLQDFI